MDPVPQKHLNELIAAAGEVAKNGLVIGASGNLSYRIDDGLMVVTTASSSMSNLRPDQIAICRIADAGCINGTTPSKEIGFHAGILRERSEVNVVLHYQAPFATTIACLRREAPSFSVIPEIPYYIGEVPTVPYLTPGSRELAEAVTAALIDHELAILINHGQVVVGTGFEQVIDRARHFELACQIILGAGDRVQLMREDEIADERRKGEANRSKQAEPPTNGSM